MELAGRLEKPVHRRYDDDLTEFLACSLEALGVTPMTSEPEGSFWLDRLDGLGDSILRAVKTDDGWDVHEGV
ncbi:hypothetical protein AB0L40_03310 [Patulibacter sp. NPDC049589]|uniref:hypothetical protein n=1 Tax=Patulibacter sp. NPDC049589 TaxID=3154731 RepID=UPI003414341D